MMSKELQQLGQLLSEGTFAAAISPSSPLVEQFAAYYALVLKWNPVLHLTTLTTPLEFYQRHLQEAFFLADYLAPTATSVFDLVPVLVCQGFHWPILRPDLQVVLVEASHTKGHLFGRSS
jgi:16S rRNA G527 N7-methylase RsmG